MFEYIPPNVKIKLVVKEDIRLTFVFFLSEQQILLEYRFQPKGLCER